MNKIFFIIPNLHRGGTERVVSILSNAIDKNLFNIHLVLLQKRGSYLKDLKDDISVIDLNIPNVRKAIFPLISLINKEKPDLVFSALSHLNLMLMMCRFMMPKEIKFIGRESSIPSIMNQKEKYPKIFDFLYRIYYNKFDAIIAQSEYMKDDLINNYNIFENKINVINNPLDFQKIQKKIELSQNPFATGVKNIIAVGSLEEVKGYDFLIHAISKIKRKDFKLSIIGEGSKENNLKILIKKLQLEKNVELLGFRDNPYVYMKYADIGILSSRFEGFPNTVLETLACKTPVIAFKCPGGISEIILENINGWFVDPENIDKLAITIERNLDTKVDKKKIYQSTYERYNLEYIINKYEKIFIDTIKKEK